MADSRRRPTSSRLHLLLASLALCALVCAAYVNSLENGFVWDDHEQIVMNPYMKPDAPLASLFTTDVRFAHQDPSRQTSAYRPLQLLTYRAVVSMSGGTPAYFHAVSISFAAAGAVAAFAVFCLLTHRAGLAFAAAALFALHPVHTESVDWIAALPELGCSLFFLLAFAFFLTSRDRVSPGHRDALRWLHGSPSLAAFGMALLWKETAVVLPLLIAVYGFVLQPSPADTSRRALAALKQSAPYWVVVAAYLVLRLVVLGTLAPGARTWALDASRFTLTALHLTLLYWAKLLLPVGLNAYYVFHPLRSFADPRVFVTILFAVAAAATLFLVRRSRLVVFGALWVCITLLPALNLNGLGRNAFAERYLYLPSAGFCLLAALTFAWLLDHLPVLYRRSAGIGLLAVVLAAFATLTILRNPVWKDDNTLFAETLKLSPEAAFVRNMVAAGQSTESAQSASAEQNYQQAIAYAQHDHPPDRLDTVIAYQGLASLYADRSQYDRALSMLGQARQIAPGDPNTTAEEGMILARAGHGSEAEARLNQLLLQTPDNENILAALGLIARDKRHDLGRAAVLFARALVVHPQQDDFNASQHNNLGAVYLDQDNIAGAIAEVKQAIAIVPEDPQFHLNLASALAASNRFDDARIEAETALRIAPNDPNASELLQRLHQQK